MNDPNSSRSPIDIVQERRELFERLADSDLPVADDAQRGLSLLGDDIEEGGR